jgi:hypothetical protein
MTAVFKKFLLLSLTVICAAAAMAQTPADTRTRTLIVFFDGLRPDYITPEAMPNLHAFSKNWSYGKEHHSVFPTVTRVNASSYSSGSYPANHGLMGNTVYFPAVDKLNGLNTGDYADLDKISAATNGHLLTAITLGEILQAAGEKMMVFSSGSTGQALMQNHTVSGGAVVNPGLIRPESFKETLVADIGAAPAKAKPNKAQHTWVTDGLLKYGLAANGPLVSAIWFSDPDGTAHADGIGSPTAMESILAVDAEFGRILEAIKSNNLTPYFNVIVSTDHGFVTNIGKEGLTEFLIKQGIKKDAKSDDVIVIAGAIYVKDHNPEVIREIVTSLKGQEWIGAIFTKGGKPGDDKGVIEGTLSFESIHWNHPDRAADILVDENWNDDKNDKGYAGSSFSPGVAGHGGFSPYEVHIPLLAGGPSFKKNFASELPTSNVDIVPTVLEIHKIAVPKTMDGRVMHELLQKSNGAKPTPKKETIKTSSTFNGVVYTLTLDRTVLGKYTYTNFTKVVRTRK